MATGISDNKLTQIKFLASSLSSIRWYFM